MITRIAQIILRTSFCTCKKRGNVFYLSNSPLYFEPNLELMYITIRYSFWLLCSNEILLKFEFE